MQLKASHFLVASQKELCVSATDIWGSPGGSVVKNPPAMQKLQETQVQSLGQEDLLGEGMVTHSTILALRISWTEEPGGLQSMGSQGV